MHRYDVAIVGSGHGGAQAAISLRQLGFTGSIAMITEDRDLPYERPPLSKDYFAGTKAFERILIRPADFWSNRDITMVAGHRVTGIDPDRKTVTAQGRDALSIGYDTLVWAAGGRPRLLSCPGAAASNLHYLRSRDDVDTILARLPHVDRVTVIGGGYIGLEVAAVLTKLGKHVVLLEALDRVLARVAGPELSQFYEAEHRARGVDIRTGTMIDRIETRDGTALAVLTRGGDSLATEMVIVGIGIVPETAALTAAGAFGVNGVDVDEYCRTSLPHVYAIGDCACHPNQFADSPRVRLESVQNASDQAKTAAAHIMGRAEPYAALPWFWSNQYDLKLQTLGLSIGHDQTIVRGDPASRSFSVLYLKDGRLIALDSVNVVRDYAQGRAHVVGRAVLDQEQLRDSTIPLRDVSVAVSP